MLPIQPASPQGASSSERAPSRCNRPERFGGLHRWRDPPSRGPKSRSQPEVGPLEARGGVEAGKILTVGNEPLMGEHGGTMGGHQMETHVKIPSQAQYTRDTSPPKRLPNEPVHDH